LMEGKKVCGLIVCVAMLMLILNHAAAERSGKLEQLHMNRPDSTWKQMKPRGPVPPSAASHCSSDGHACPPPPPPTGRLPPPPPGRFP